ncbi:MAG: PQQ-binding-like beta-propeller repeat protein [Thaumarchaeota archaeon]|nr:PQQ-binding-like beta-propeller repeat protein [Nitrososphaerota archaeon]
MKRGRILALLFVSLVLLQSFPTRATDWAYPNANGSGTNFFPQSQISEGNFGSLGLAWTFSFPVASPPKGLNVTGEGAIAPPLIVGGVVYVVMNDLEVLALGARTGATIWRYQPVLNRSGLALGYLAGHVHGLTYHEGNIWLSLPDCSAIALDALRGTLTAKLSRICADIPGNSGTYSFSGAPLTFDGNVMFWTASSVSEGTTAGRGFVAAINVTDGKILWRWYISPPAGGDPKWDAETCAPPCHGNVSPYPGDWGSLGLSNGSTRAGAGPSWGQPAVDQNDGLILIGTSQPSPDWNATYRPGPNLYSDSVVALEIKSGKLAWYFQTTPHDLYDFDCGWNVALANTVIGGMNRTTVFKACKNGYVYALDAKSGELLWEFNPPSLARLNTKNADYAFTGKYNATGKWTQTDSGVVKQCPGINGGIESDISVAYGKVFVAAHNFCSVVRIGPVSKVGASISGASGISFDFLHANTTIYAIDASTGKESWEYFLPSVAYRGWLTSTGGMVIASTLYGRILALDSQSGQLVASITVGSSLYEGVTLGTDQIGEIKLFQLTTAPSYGGFVTAVPGVLLVYGLTRSGSPLELWLPWVALGVAAAAAAFVIGFFRLRRKTANN